jgi:DNA polymerase theta
MELNGFGFSNNECEQIKHVLRAKLRSLEQEAYGLAKRSFSLTSPEEVSRVLFLELKLPPDGQTDVSTSPGVRPTRGGRRRKVKYFSTSKDVLEKLMSLHPLPKVIQEWRRINSALTKIVFPVQKEQVVCEPPLSMSRIFPNALTHTATGRVTFVEPNLQNVPKDFDINLPTLISDTPPEEDVEGTKRRKGKVYAPRDDFESSSPGPQYSVSLRSAFVPFSNGILLAADYSQLELRLIAHLSSDRKLTGFLNAGGDAFRMIAGEIFRLPQDQISDDQRQRAKQVCYGIIYGIGAKALGQALGVDENEAGLFVDAFKARFTAVRAYLKRTVDECRRLTYVTTISGRRRYLPNIRSSNAAARSQAERQAVNTTVQGSAADLVKRAMANIDRRLCEQFPRCWRTHRQKSEDDLGERSGRCGKREGRFRGGNLVLQLHDELLFEVVEQDFSKVAEIVREEMENAMKLSVKTPVKMKSGKSWGTMVPME